MEEKKTRPRRAKRTKVDIERSINKAAKEIILKKGFSDMTVLDIIKRAKIEAVTFYLRYKNLDDFCENFVKEYDYWFSDMLKTSNDNLYSQEGYAAIFERLLDELKDDSVMLELLRWEVNTANEVTKRTAMNREFHTLPLTHEYDRLFKNTGIDFVAISALIVAGIYYLSLHRRCSTFCGIDMTTDEGKERIQKAITNLSVILFNHREKCKQTTSTLDVIAERMKEKGLSEEDIAYCLKI